MVERMIESHPSRTRRRSSSRSTPTWRRGRTRVRAARGAGVQGEPARLRRPARARGRRRPRLPVRGAVPGPPESPRVMITVPPRQSRPRCRHGALLGDLGLGTRARASNARGGPRRQRPGQPRVRGAARLRRGAAREGSRARPDGGRAPARRAAAGSRDRHLGGPPRARARPVRGVGRDLAGRAGLRERAARAVRGLARTRDAGAGRRPEATFVAVAGDEAVGYAKFSSPSAAPTRAHHDLTAVRRAWRGRGIARALKPRRSAGRR